MASVVWSIPTAKVLTSLLENVLLVTMDMHSKMANVSTQPMMYQLLIQIAQNSKIIFASSALKTSSSIKMEPALQSTHFAKPIMNSMEPAPAAMTASC